jgi:hypothetical protein
MASSSLDNSPARGFFHDLHSFKDFVVIVSVCAPDKFIYEDWREPDNQLNLDRAFAGLRYGLELAAREKGESALLARCRELVEQSYVEYRARRDHAGQLKLEEVEKLLKKIPSQ